MSDVILLGLPPSSYVRTAMMVCENKNVSYTLQPVDFRSDAYRAHHPFGRMPVLQHGSVSLYETLAIATYIDAVFDGPDLQPQDPLARAKMMQWISTANDYLYDLIVGCCVAERFVKPMRGLSPDEDRIAQAVPKINECLDVLEAGLTDGPYFCGDTVTLADLFIAPILVYYNATPEGQASMPQRTHVSNWLQTMAQTPGFGAINKLGG
jgi:glutathione S-transferase